MLCYYLNTSTLQAITAYNLLGGAAELYNLPCVGQLISSARNLMVANLVVVKILANCSLLFKDEAQLFSINTFNDKKLLR